MKRIFRVDLDKINQSKDGLLMCRLAMAVNDLRASNTFYKLAKSFDVDADVQLGLRLHASRLQMAYLSAGLEVLGEGDNIDIIEKRVSRLHPSGRKAFALIREAFFGEDGKNEQTRHKTITFSPDYKDRIQKVRDKVTFHYDEKEAKQAIGYLIKNKSRKMNPVCHNRVRQIPVRGIM